MSINPVDVLRYFLTEKANIDASRTMQRYAAEIYRLQLDHERVGVSQLVELLDVSHQAISRMMKRLEAEGYLTNEPYRGAILTPAGEQVAMPAIRRHRLAEVFLVQVMGYDWGAAHELSDEFELGLNEELEDRIDEMLGYPKACPHGEPIPTKDGQITYPNDIQMSQFGTQVHGLISRVRTHDADKLRYISELGMLPGNKFYLMSCAPFKGPLRIQMDGFDQVIGYELASVIWVEPISS